MLLPDGKWRCPETGTVYAKKPQPKFKWDINLGKKCKRWGENIDAEYGDDIECRIFVRVMGASSTEVIAQACGMSRTYVEKLEARALEKLRKQNALIDFAGEHMEAQGCSLDIV